MNHTRHLLLAAASLVLAWASSPAQAGAVLDRVKAAGEMKVATDANWAPQSFMNAQNELDGFDIDVAKEIGKRMGVKVTFVTPGWDIITAGNWAGRWDMSVDSMTPTKERAKKLNFAAVYYYTPAAVAVHKDSKAKTLADLNGKVVGATTSSTFEAYGKHELTLDSAGAPPFTYQFTPKEVRSYEHSTTAFDDLRIGDGTRLDAVISSEPSIRDAIKSGYPFKQLGEAIFYEPLVISTDLGDPEFSAKIAAAVSDMKKDGTLTALSKKWYGTDYSVAK